MVSNEELFKFEKFLETEDLLKQINEALTLGSKHFFIDYRDLARFDPELATNIMEKFDEYVDYFSHCFSIRFRFINIASCYETNIWKLRSKDIGKFVVITGYIRTITDVLHYLKAADYTCTSCGMVFEACYSKPIQCAECGGKSFTMTDKIYSDIQKVVLEEDLKVIEPTQTPRRITVHLLDDLCSEDIDKMLQPSKLVRVAGIVSEEKANRFSKEYKKIILAHSIEVLNDERERIKFTAEDKVRFKEVSHSKTFFDDLSESIFPTIYGNTQIKRALFLQLVGGSNVYKDGKLSERGNIHILLVGNPGTAKSVMLKRVVNLLPNSRFVSAISSSGVGLVASVSYSKELNSWVLEAGALPMANGSMLMVDEIDKANSEDIAMLNNALVDLEVTVDKASVHATLKCNTSLLAAANPKNRVFDPYEPVWKQIKLPKDFMDRFDLVFPVDNVSTESDQKNVATRIFSKYKRKVNDFQVYSTEFVRKYVLYARQQPAPEITDDVEEYITEKFVKLMKPSSEENNAYFSSRLLTNIIRLTQAAAKARLKSQATIDDANVAIDILITSLKKQEILTENHTINLEKLEAITPKPKRERKYYVKNFIKNNFNEEINGVEYSKIVEGYISEMHGPEDEVEEIVEQLKREGEVFEPKRGILKVI